MPGAHTYGQLPPRGGLKVPTGSVSVLLILILTQPPSHLPAAARMALGAVAPRTFPVDLAGVRCGVPGRLHIAGACALGVLSPGRGGDHGLARAF